MSDPTRTEEHRRYRELLGSYVLGRLGAAEAAELERHLDGCEACRTEEAELRAVAGLMPAPDAADWSLPPDLEDRVVAAVFSEQRAEGTPRRDPGRFGLRNRFVMGLGAAAAVLVAAVGLAIFLSTGQEGQPGLGEAEPIAFSEAPRGVSTDAAVVAHTWGTEVNLEVEGLRPGGVYTVLIERDDGGQVSAGTFVAVEAQPVECRLNGAVLRQDARAISVTDAKGNEVLRSELKPRPDLASSYTASRR